MGLFVPIYAWKVVAGSVVNCVVLFSVLGGNDGIYPNLWVICCCNLGRFLNSEIALSLHSHTACSLVKSFTIFPHLNF